MGENRLEKFSSDVGNNGIKFKLLSSSVKGKKSHALPGMAS